MEDNNEASSPSLAKLLVVEDHALVREGIRDMLAGEPRFEVIAEARDGLEALKLCRRSCPDLVLMDIMMPKMNGIEATRAIKEQCPQTSVLMVTSYNNPEHILEAVRAGAAGYILKEATQQEVIEAVREVLSGGVSLDSMLAMELVRRLSREVNLEEGAVSEATKRPEGAIAELLTPREAEVVRFLAQGKTNREIAQDLRVSISTAKAHVQHVIAKLEVSDRTQAAVRAMELGLFAKQEDEEPL